MKRLGIRSKKDLGVGCRCCDSKVQLAHNYGVRRERHLVKIQLKQLVTRGGNNVEC